MMRSARSTIGCFFMLDCSLCPQLGYLGLGIADATQYFIGMFAQPWCSITLFVRHAGDTREREQGTKCCLAFTICHSDAASLGLGIMQCFIETIDRSNAGIDIGKLSEPLITCFRLEDRPKHIYSLLTFSWSTWRMERQKFEVSNTCAEGMPEFWLKSGQGDMFAVLCLVDIVAREATIEAGASWLRNFVRIQIGCGKEWQQREHPLGHRDIDIAPLARFCSPH